MFVSVIKCNQFFGLLLIVLTILANSFEFKAQRLLVFDKGGKVKMYRYYEKDIIYLKMHDGRKFNGPITKIADRSFYVGQKKVDLDSVKFVHLYKNQSLFRPLGSFFMVGAMAYLSIDTFNRLINSNQPLIEEESVKASAYLFIGSVICREMIHRRFKISKKRPLKIIDISI